MEGRAAHESMPDRGLNAITQAARIITALDDTLIPGARQRTHPLLGPSTYNIGTIHGGLSRNTVPDRCVFQIAKRWLPGDSRARHSRRDRGGVRRRPDGGKVSVTHEPEFDVIPHPPLELPPGTSSRGVSRGGPASHRRKPAVIGWPAFTDAALIQAAGIPAIVFGPGASTWPTAMTSTCRSPNSTSAQIYAALAVQLCGPYPFPVNEGRMTSRTPASDRAEL